MMKEQLVKAMQRNHLLNMMYMAKMEQCQKCVSRLLKLLMIRFKHIALQGKPSDIYD
ncbi:hypothetical protein [Lysinibacillus fusiformis]|uniref:hypothetical protein n=1 Tax=Lysinibacillus fusiformis TaxID=28031 RepID=UPI001ABFB09A|nr:hypothetical protein [Lysinibacillus fusiformis]